MPNSRGHTQTEMQNVTCKGCGISAPYTKHPATGRVIGLPKGWVGLVLQGTEGVLHFVLCAECIAMTLATIAAQAPAKVELPPLRAI